MLRGTMRYAFLLILIGGFFNEGLSDLSCFLNRLENIVFPMHYEEMAEVCNEPESLEVEVHHLIKLCSVVIPKNDVTSFVERICNPELQKTLLLNEECLKKDHFVNTCVPCCEKNMSKEIACLRSLWKYYDCMVSQVGDLCGESAAKATRNSTKALHILARNLCSELED